MWRKPEKPVPLHPSQLVEGLYIWIDMSWEEHPFIYNRFKIKTKKQLEALMALCCAGRLYYHPEKSDAIPGEFNPVAAKALDEAASNNDALTKAKAARLGAAKDAVSGGGDKEETPEKLEARRVMEAKKASLWARKDAAARADRAWEAAAKVVREALLGISSSPRQAGDQLRTLSATTASQIANGGEVLMHLLGDKEGDGPQFHALNVTTLSLLLGKAAGFSEKVLTELSMGALAHDIGKYKIPKHILSSSARARYEEELYRQHGLYGLELAAQSGAFGDASMSAISDHHEFLDGTGFPKGKKNLSPIAQIVGLADRYDRLCSPEISGKPGLMPAEAVAQIYKKEGGRYDARLLALLVRLLGVYPPGTVVRLSDDTLGMVVAPGRESLKPVVLPYMPECPKAEVPTIDLSAEGTPSIAEPIRPATLPEDVVAWLRPRQRLSYFFSTEKKS